MRNRVTVKKGIQFRAEDLKSLQEQRNDAVQEMKNITETAETEKRAFSEEEKTRFDALEAQVKQLDASIERMERARDLSLNVVSQKKKEELTVEEKEERAFAAYLRNELLGERAGDDVNLTKGDNGAVIPVTIARKIIEKVREISPVFQMATRYNVKGKLEVPYFPATVGNTTPDIEMDYADEFEELTSTSGKFGTIELTGFLAGALTKVSKSLINNSDFNIVSFVISHMATNIAVWLEGELLKGTNGKVTGAIPGITQIVPTAAAGAITADELIALQESVPDAFQNNACWIMSRNTRTALRQLKDGEERYILNQDATTKWGYTLFGKPVYVSENMADIAGGATTILYGDFSGLAVKLSEDLEIDVLRERFATQHAVGVVAWMEVDAKVENAQKLAKLVQKAS